MLRRRRDNDLWVLPGGGMDMAYSLPGTALRDVREGTGLDVSGMTTSAQGPGRGRRRSDN
ncbi:hypothetical protein I3J09_09605 [Streptomyces clavuligerus]|nr:hypothetical protein [Streptomyces clavuligerus]QPL66505.1 hypothetical protein I3J04_09590 [Streptomyces clavuligerus]QPL72540.1 hypothetical protein I3J05_09605 [Streptomyces clavuligerus]QPL78615.1 hypothetical protein I3J06_09605 [Streptomyces clavuligerus]QPL84644.1 hypothetical protein I3J07_09645 [Streptomyces clavuligerus]